MAETDNKEIDFLFIHQYFDVAKPAPPPNVEIPAQLVGKVKELNSRIFQLHQNVLNGEKRESLKDDYKKLKIFNIG